MSDAAARRIWIERRRWPDRPQSRARGYLLGHDEHGTWLGLPAGHEVLRGDAVLYRGPNPVVMCIPDDGWWVANWYDGAVELFVDVTTPARWFDDTVVLVDLDYGVMVQQGAARLVDAERFEEQRLLYEYPSTIEAGARAAASDVLALADAGTPPFALEVASGWFAMLRVVTDGAANGG
ncbi:DUF402 domain-containing protein [Actinomarinicola tropica]|uniref:DUF402 domain-containing protein n=1 Tax=Actinomarinicola tropica TaxID=2789776 RepID=A0A5Q2RQP7_9ACTN|nr:DUF402 domain-containing protein [Actinomarinicola tropica]QGG96467.1 DUF402 domain-containing protein [Actinomarinicola tropica]